MPLSKDRNIIVPQEELDRQMEFCGLVHTVLETRLDGRKPLAYVHTFGCQGNVADSERLKGLLEKMGFGFTEEPENADISLFNTCAVREHAEDRLFGNVGALKKIKEKNPDFKIILCGCMMQQERIAENSALTLRINSLSCFIVRCLPASVYLISKIPTALSRKTCPCTGTVHSKRGCR